jgi:hypothetical protein
MFKRVSGLQRAFTFSLNRGRTFSKFGFSSPKLFGKELDSSGCSLSPCCVSVPFASILYLYLVEDLFGLFLFASDL